MPMVESFVNFIMTQFVAHKALLLVIVIGMVVGLLSQMLLPAKGFGLIGTFAIGIAGCYLGNMFVKEYLTMIDNDTLKNIASGVAGAMALTVVVNIFRPGKHKDKTAYRNNT